jgi:protoporphyrinogen oxidase
MLDVAIIGAGPAGLMAGYRLRDLELAVYEAAPFVGGRTHSVNIGGEWANTGAQFVYLDTESHRICQELGVEVRPVEPSTVSCHYRGITIVASDADELIAQLPIAPEAKRDLTNVFDRIRQVYPTYVEHGLTENSKELQGVTFSEFVGGVHPEAAEFLDMSVLGSSATLPALLSARYAMRYYVSYFVCDGKHRGFIPTGMDTISHRLRDSLTDKVFLDSAVRSVNRCGNGFRLLVAHGKDTEVVEAKHVVTAVPGPLVNSLMPWLPKSKLDAIAAIPFQAAITLAVTLESPRGARWEDVFYTPILGHGFQAIFQAQVGKAWRPRPKERAVLTLYSYEVGNSKVEAGDVDDDTLIDAWLSGLFDVFPEARGRVVATHLTRREFCFPICLPDRGEFTSTAEASIDGVHFAGDYTSMSSGTHGAILSGERAAAEVRAALAIGSQSVGMGDQRGEWETTGSLA